MTVFGGARRVPGLRREEVAQLVDVSTAYSTRMERGNLRGVSESVLRSLARTLRMGEHSHPVPAPSQNGRDEQG
ncbi:helix-turn-helix domain-containing protein [Streptomyces sp. NPDC008137]|uniref:helix-turn-helix domain-containing protein n=1 Tax=Streptomyces sp. NPDC008137 TaxID=3364813 RepID=UPI0036E771F7